RPLPVRLHHGVAVATLAVAKKTKDQVSKHWVLLSKLACRAVSGGSIERQRRNWLQSIYATTGIVAMFGTFLEPKQQARLLAASFQTSDRERVAFEAPAPF